MGHHNAEILVSKLYLDGQNARHDDLEAESDIIQTLLKHEKASEIARSIATVGELNPLERVGVVENKRVPGTYLVVEGNRRVCALKMLLDPSKAPLRYAKQVQKYRTSGVAVPKKIDVVVFDTLEEAMPWISTRHQGEQGGVGTRPWSAKGKAKHAARLNSRTANQLAVELIDYAQKRALISEAEAGSIAATTITRYLNTPVVRHVLGLTSAKSMEVDVSQEAFDRTLETFLKDALPAASGATSRVNSRASSENRKDYAKQLEKEGHGKIDRVAPHTLSAKDAQPTVKRSRVPNPDNRASVIAPTFQFGVRSDAVLTRIYKELRGIDAHEFSFSAAYLLRMFVERLVNRYAQKHGIQFAQKKLHQLIDSCVKHIEADTSWIASNGGWKFVDNALAPLRTMVSDETSRISPKTLGGWVHGSSIPTRAEINRRWDTLEPGLKLITARL